MPSIEIKCPECNRLFTISVDERSSSYILQVLAKNFLCSDCDTKEKER